MNHQVSGNILDPNSFLKVCRWFFTTKNLSIVLLGGGWRLFHFSPESVLRVVLLSQLYL